MESVTNDHGRVARGDVRGVTVLAREHFNPTDLSVTAQAERIKTSDPQAVIAWSSGTPTGTVLRGLHDAGLDVPVLSSNANMIPTQLAQYTGFAPRELYFPGRRASFLDTSAPRSVQAAQAVYFDAFKAAGAIPNQGTTPGWDPAMILVDAFRKLGTTATAAQSSAGIQPNRSSSRSAKAAARSVYEARARAAAAAGVRPGDRLVPSPRHGDVRAGYRALFEAHVLRRPCRAAAAADRRAELETENEHLRARVRALASMPGETESDPTVSRGFASG